MEFVLRDLSYDACLVYLDGVIAISCLFQEQLNNLRKVCQRLREAHLKFTPRSSSCSGRRYDTWTTRNRRQE